MSGFDFENNPEGEWENHDELVWNEFNWNNYLQKTDKEIIRFLKFYQEHKQRPNHLDEIARLMNWESEDWQAYDSTEGEDNKGEKEPFEELPLPEAAEGKVDEPYTVHRHPVYIVTHGLYKYINRCWEQFTLDYQHALSPTFASQFSTSLHKGEFNAMMAVNALDMADYNLAVCHLKHSLNAINQTFTLANRIPPKYPNHYEAFMKELRCVCFDLRELWLRVMKECREEHRRRHKDRD